MKAESFTLNSDYATLKNDAKGSASVIAPASAVIAGSGYAEYHSDITIGAKAAITRVHMSSSQNASQVQSTRLTTGDRIGVSSGSPATYGIAAFIYRLNDTTVRCQAYIPNPYGASLTTTAVSETFTFYVTTFLPPYA